MIDFDDPTRKWNIEIENGRIIKMEEQDDPRLLTDEEIKEAAKYIPTKEEWAIKPDHRYWQDKKIAKDQLAKIDKLKEVCPDKKQFVIGFLFRNGEVALIEKKRPEWQRGKLNGIGGHIEQGETPLEAMKREFNEEAGELIDEWEYFCTMNYPEADIYCFRLFGEYSVATKTDEIISWYPINDIPNTVIPNLHWLIPLARYDDDTLIQVSVKSGTTCKGTGKHELDSPVCPECGDIFKLHDYGTLTDDVGKLTEDLTLCRLAEWIAIEHGETIRQSDKYTEEAQGLFDLLIVIGFKLEGVNFRKVINATCKGTGKADSPELREILNSYKKWVLNLDKCQGERCNQDDAITLIIALFPDVEEIRAQLNAEIRIELGTKAFEKGKKRERERIAEIAGYFAFNKPWCSLNEEQQEASEDIADQIKALWPDVEKVRDELVILKALVNTLSKKLDDREADLIEAKREAEKRITKRLEEIDEVASDHKDFTSRVCAFIVELRQALREGEYVKPSN